MVEEVVAPQPQRFGEAAGVEGRVFVVVGEPPVPPVQVEGRVFFLVFGLVGPAFPGLGVLAPPGGGGAEGGGSEKRQEHENRQEEGPQGAFGDGNHRPFREVV